MRLRRTYGAFVSGIMYENVTCGDDLDTLGIDSRLDGYSSGLDVFVVLPFWELATWQADISVIE